jgi:tRNA threonylcarbamoyladenosine biosynthesis protein TsaB
MESYILHIETATKACSVAISKNDALVSLVEATDINYSHAEKLNLFIEEALEKAKLSIQDLSAVAVSKGPGSFTGLRIGVSTAKGIAYALDLPLLSCNTLDCIAYGFLSKHDIAANDLVVPMIDARRREVYMKIVDSKLNSLTQIEANVIDDQSFDELSKEERTIHLVGDGAEKFLADFESKPFVKVHPKLFPSAAFMLPFAYRAYQDKNVEDLAYFEPYYLKDFVAIKPRKLF